MRRNPERLAWVVLLASFFICVSLAIGTPLGIRYYILHARVPQSITLEVQQGPLRAQLSGRGAFVSISETRDDVRERTIIATDSTLGRLVLHAPRVNGPIVASVQLYNNTEVILSTARSPRYPASHLPHQIALGLRAGLVRIRVFDDGDRPTIVRVQTPQGVAMLTKGRYEVTANVNQTELTVYDGAADLNKAEWSAQVRASERPECALVNGERIIGPLPYASNFIANGDFAARVEGPESGLRAWNVYNRVDVAGEAGGTVQATVIENIPALVITRRGEGPAQTGITQELGANVGGLRSLRLHLLLRVEEQDVALCGSLGSECPVMVRIDYVDANGIDQEWTQGFYALPDVNAANPEVCVTCSTHNEHILVPQGTWYAYLSSNLIPQLSQGGHPPQLIKAITIYASGHTYQAAVAEVELSGQ